MKILQVTPILVPENLWTGPHRVVFDISKRLSEMGNKVTVCTSDMLNMTTRIKRNPQSVFDGFEIVRERNISVHLYRMSGLLITPELCKFLSERIQDYDIVHIHEYTTYQNIVVHKFAKKYGVPYVLQVHGSLLISDKFVRKWFYYLFFGSNLLKDASKVIALSRLEAEQYKAVGLPEEKIAVIPNGIDLSEYAELPSKGAFRKEFGIDEDKKVVLYLGRIHRTKGIDFLIKAYARLIMDLKFKDGLLVIAGPDGGYLGEAKSLVSALGVSESVLFTGLLTQYQKVCAFVDCSIVVSPERLNVFLLVPLEAAACGKPVIVSSTNYISHMVREGEFGFSVKYGDINALAEIMGKMLNNEDLSREIGQKGRKFIFKNFNWNDIVIKFEKVYEDVSSRNLQQSRI